MQIKKASEMKRSDRFNILIYAEPGAGKTSTLRYLEGKTLVLDIDGTSRVLAGLENIDVVELNPERPTKDMVEFYGFAKANLANYDNIVLDNLSHYQKLWFMEKGKNTKSGQPELQHYGIFDTHLIELISTFNKLDANIVYTAWEDTRQIQLESGQLYNQFLPAIREKVVNHIMGIIPVVARLTRNPETKARGFIMQKSNGTFAKNQLDNREGCLQENLFNIGSEEDDV